MPVLARFSRRDAPEEVRVEYVPDLVREREPVAVGVRRVLDAELTLVDDLSIDCSSRGDAATEAHFRWNAVPPLLAPASALPALLSSAVTGSCPAFFHVPPRR